MLAETLRRIVADLVPDLAAAGPQEPALEPACA
jgi:hypothetical protein